MSARAAVVGSDNIDGAALLHAGGRDHYWLLAEHGALEAALTFFVVCNPIQGPVHPWAQDAEKAALARESVAWNQRQPLLANMFPELRNVPGGEAGPDASTAEPAPDRSAPEEAGEQVDDADWAAVQIAAARLAEGDPAAASACMDRALRWIPHACPAEPFPARLAMEK